MSLINDALKKAARQRAEEQADVVAPMPGGGSRRVSRQGAPMRTQTLILIGAAALVLVVVSVVVTGILITGKPETKPVAAATQAPSATPTQAPAPKIVLPPPAVAVSVPQQTTPAPVAAAAPAAAPAKLAPTPSPSPPPVVQAPEPAAPSSPSPVAATILSHNELVQAAVDAFQISGVRMAGSSSKALVDGHVYKLNDIVDKALGLRLTKVDEDHLTFVDRDGNSFVRTF